MSEHVGRLARRPRWLGAGVLGLMAIMAIPVGASLSPGKWTVQRVIAVKDNAWIAIHSRRHHTSYYRYQSTTEVRMTRTGTGCVIARRSLGDVVHKDVLANGTWTRTVITPGQKQPFAPMRGAVAVLPVGGTARLSIKAGAVMLRYGDKGYELMSAQRIARWAKLIGVTLNDDVRIAELMAPGDDLSRPQPAYLVLETPHRDIDADYVRFVVPVDLNTFEALLARGITDPVRLAASQPQPTGC